MLCHIRTICLNSALLITVVFGTVNASAQSFYAHWYNNCKSGTCNETKNLPPFTQADIVLQCMNYAKGTNLECKLKEGNKPNVSCGAITAEGGDMVFKCTCINNTPADPKVHFFITC